jgi:hypothetical protein
MRADQEPTKEQADDARHLELLDHQGATYDDGEQHEEDPRLTRRLVDVKKVHRSQEPVRRESG